MSKSVSDRVFEVNKVVSTLGENEILPSSTAGSSDAKLLAIKIIPAASLDTSDADLNIAIPTSAFLNDGASLTPSPLTFC